MPPDEPTPEQMREVVERDFAETSSHEAGHTIAAVVYGCHILGVHLYRSNRLRPGEMIDPANRDRLFLGSATHTAPTTDMGRAIIGYAGVLAEWLNTGRLQDLSDDEIFQMTERGHAMSDSDRRMVAAVGDNGKHEAFDRALLLVRSYSRPIADLANHLTAVFKDEGALDSIIPIPPFVLPPPSPPSSQ